ncbi:MAG: hypothetical protein DWQ01_14745 [Planctomycetota bacterium]|nr:MAG: hypothetical protein DWQ01_14745 [Planctomycetota bacterium]
MGVQVRSGMRIQFLPKPHVPALARFLLFHPRRSRGQGLPGLILIGLVMIGLPLLPAGCGGGDHPRGYPWADRPNLVLVVVDTLRQDHLQPYGYDPGYANSPHLQALAAESVTVEGMIGVSSWTLPSMATLFTGMTPQQHEVMRLPAGDARMRARSRLPQTETLAGSLQKHGYATSCVQSNWLLMKNRGTRFQQGFDAYLEVDLELDENGAPAPHRGSTADQVVDLGLQWLEQRKDSKPWFMTLHFFEPHSSYEDHSEVRFLDPTYQGWVQGGLPNREYRKWQEKSNEADRRQLRSLYDEEIWKMDQALGRLLEQLRRRDDWDRTLFVFTTDHGEELAERGYIGHTQTLHFEQVDLPLMVRFPGALHGGSRRQAYFSQQHLFATLLDFCGAPEVSGRGRSQAAWLVEETAGLPKEPVPMEVDFIPILREHREKYVRKRAVLKSPYKYVLDLMSGEEQLFFLPEDPGERNNLAQDPNHAATLEQLRTWVENHSWWQGEE